MILYCTVLLHFSRLVLETFTFSLSLEQHNPVFLADIVFDSEM